MSPRGIFITGATGYVGRRLHALLPDCVRPVFALSRHPLAHTDGPVRFVNGDLLTPAAYRGALSECGTVIHLAAATGRNRREVYFRDNVEGTRRLLDTAVSAGVRNFLYVSTIAATFADQSRYYYAQSKKEAEHLVAASGLNYLILRPTIIIGRDAPVLVQLAKLAAAPVTPVFGDGRIEVQPVFVDDLVNCLIAVIEEGYFPNTAVDLGGPQVLTMNEFLGRIRQASGLGRPRLLHVPVRMVSALIAALETVCFPLTPFTSGQLASFTNAGVARPNPLLSRRLPAMRSVDQVLAALN